MRQNRETRLTNCPRQAYLEGAENGVSVGMFSVGPGDEQCHSQGLPALLSLISPFLRAIVGCISPYDLTSDGPNGELPYFPRS